MGDLGTIPKEYDAAITTSSYGGLNSILVENDEVA
jgi:chromosome segregation ATPase